MFLLEKHTEIDSTNNRAKLLAAEGKRNICVVADRQTGGRGRMGRQFFSPDGSGLYFSLVITPAVKGEDGALLTTFAAVCVAEVLEKLTGQETAIKWVNDIYMNGKKICGILTEGSVDFATGAFRHAVIGIGINLGKTTFPEEIASIASDVESETGVRLSRDSVLQALLNRFEVIGEALRTRDFMETYRNKCFVIGKEVEVIRGSESFPAKALDVNRRGELVVETENGTMILPSGEVSVKM
jgi:BirA family biotin operon repressor/biotin-[acetyl-CoA-carboxylase] ligase